MSDDDTDVVVLGAGVAGVTAARALAAEGLGVVVVEAGTRVGGRVWSVRDFTSVPVEAGAEFIHGVGAATWDDSRAAGLHVQPVPYRWSWLHLGATTRWMPAQLARPATWRTFSILWELRRRAADESAAAFMARKRYSGCAEELAALTLAAHLPGDVGEISVRGLVADGVVGLELGLNHRVLDGYDSLAAHIAAGLDVRLGWRATEVAWAPDGVVVSSRHGRCISALACLCTIPHGVLATGDVVFDPPLPQDKADAVARIRTGPVAKVLLCFSERFWPRRMAQVACGTGPMTLYWPTSFGTDGPPVLLGYATGPRAWALSGAGPDAVAEIATADLRRLFPRARPEALLSGVRFVDWTADPNARGGYTFLPPGAVGARAALAAADTGALFWAGSATSWEPIADTVEAAYLSGCRAAREITGFLAAKAG